jgi:plastocyanin
VAAVGAAVMAVGLAVDSGVVAAGFVVTLLAAGGWLGQSWREDPRWDTRQSLRLGERFVAPVGIPLAAFAIIVFVVGTTSRVLLATSKNVSVVVAIVLAVGVLVIFALLATRPHVSRGVITAVVAVAGVTLVSAGVAGAAIGERKFHPHEPHGTELLLVAKNTQFDKKDLEAPAGQKFTLRFVNDDANVYHNVGIYTALSGGSPVVDGEPVKGVAEADYTFEVPNPGTYGFRCDFHVNMVGTLNVK